MELVLVGVFAFVCILIGFILNAMLQTIRSSKGGGKKNLTTAPGLEEVARLSRDIRTKHLVVEIGDQAYKSVGDLSSEDRQNLTMTAVDLRTWLGIFPSEKEPEESASFVTPSKASATPTQFSTESDLSVEAGMLQRKPDLNPLKMFSEAIQESRKSVEEETPKSIVAQIDEILQRKLEDSPLSGRGVRLVETPGQGITVMVGLTRYNDVEDIPEADIRDIIHEAVSEWESQLPDRM
jgi:hypothetical protein